MLKGSSTTSVTSVQSVRRRTERRIEANSWKVVKNLPNLLTLIRIICIPLIIVFLSIDKTSFNVLAAISFAFASITDLIDGFWARRTSQVTTFGKFFDPLADKLLVSAAFIMMIPLGRLPAWIVFLFIAREIAITGLRSIAAIEGLTIPSSMWGKYKTVFQCLAIICLILYKDYFSWHLRMIAYVLVAIALWLTLYSAFLYAREFLKSK